VDERKIDLKKLGEAVRFRRLGKGWSLADLADKSGVSKAYISDLENGSAGTPNIQYVYAIAVALDTTLDELLSDATARVEKPKKRRAEDLPQGLAELQAELKLSDDDVEKLAQINFRGNRPKDIEGWRFLLEAIQMVSQRNARR